MNEFQPIVFAEVFSRPRSGFVPLVWDLSRPDPSCQELLLRPLPPEEVQFRASCRAGDASANACTQSREAFRAVPRARVLSNHALLRLARHSGQRLILTDFSSLALEKALWQNVQPPSW